MKKEFKLQLICSPNIDLYFTKKGRMLECKKNLFNVAGSRKTVRTSTQEVISHVLILSSINGEFNFN